MYVSIFNNSIFLTNNKLQQIAIIEILSKGLIYSIHKTVITEAYY